VPEDPGRPLSRIGQSPWPRVLIADKLSPAAVDIFKNRGVDVDMKTGLTKDELIAVIGDYDGIAIRSGAKLDKDVIAAAGKLQVIARAGIGVDNVDIPAATAKGDHRDEHPVRQLDHHRRARHRHDVRPGPPAARRRRPPRPASGRRTASWASSSTPRRSA
jgi:hypothetical protein